MAGNSVGQRAVGTVLRAQQQFFHVFPSAALPPSRSQCLQCLQLAHTVERRWQPAPFGRRFCNGALPGGSGGASKLSAEVANAPSSGSSSSSSSTSPPAATSPAGEVGESSASSSTSAGSAGDPVGATAQAPKEEGASSSPKSGDGKPPEGKAADGGKTDAESGSGAKSSGSGSKADKASASGGPFRPDTITIAAAALTFLAYAWYSTSDSGPPEQEVTIQMLIRDFILPGKVERMQIVVNRSFCRVFLKQDSTKDGGRVLIVQLGTPEAFEAKVEQMQATLGGLAPQDHVPIQYTYEANYWQLLHYVPTALIFLAIFMGMRGMAAGGPMGGGPGGPGGGGRNIFNMGKAFAPGKKDVKSTVKFADVAGLQQAKQEVVEFVDFLKAPAKYVKLGAKIPKGGLLVGPPGTGKTLLAKAVAGEAECNFYSISGSEFVEMFVGVGPSRVRDLFKTARENEPSIIFIDEIDAVGKKRSSSGNGGGNDERENTLNQMLVEMDGFASGAGVVVLAGTNRVDTLDPALTRPGRFDRQIAIDRPDLREREEIFQVHMKPLKLEVSLSKADVAHRMAALTPGFVGADIANICNEAAIFAARRGNDVVEMEDFERATERVMAGLPKSSNLMSKIQRRTVALHESGHAVVGWFLEHSDPLLKVSIVARSSGALGFAQYLPEEMALHSKEGILDKIAVSLGGRAAEELFVGKISTGASDDLDKVTKMAYAMVTVYGMNTNSNLGLLSYGGNAREQFYKPYSEETGWAIDQEAKKYVDDQYKRVKELLLSKQDVLLRLTEHLLEKETLVYSDLREILGERPYGIKQEYASFVTAGSPYSFAASSGKTAAAAGDDNSGSPGTEEPTVGSDGAPRAATAAAA